MPALTEDTVLIRRTIAYVIELYRELTAENGAPSLGTQNQVVEFILADPELREAAAQWGQAADPDEATTQPLRRLPCDATYQRARAYLRRVMDEPAFTRPGQEPGDRRGLELRGYLAEHSRGPRNIGPRRRSCLTDPSAPTRPRRSAAEPMRGSILRGWKNIVARGYVAVYQDCRGRHGSEGEDRVYADDAADGYDTLDWIAGQDWCNQRVGMSGSSAGATTTFAAASTRHPSLRAFFAQAGASSIYDDVIYEGQGIEMERLWLWVARNIPGLSRSHREAVMRRSGISAAELDAAAASAAARYERLEAARDAEPPFVGSADWLRLPLTRSPDFALWQPFL